MDKKGVAGGTAAAAAGATPAGGASLGTGGQQADGAGFGLILANDRDRRALTWLRQQVGDPVIAAAVRQLAGGRKPYVSNVAKVLGLQIPDAVAVTPVEVARARLSAMKQLLGKRT